MKVFIVFVITHCVLLGSVVSEVSGRGGNSTEDQCGKCESGGCHLISGIFTQTHLPSGYSKVTRIPRGACHVNITQTKASANYIALKIHRGQYLLNGHWSPTSSRRFRALGTTFVYRRPLGSEPGQGNEYVRARGPLQKSVDVMILHRGTNPGIWYSYKIPTNKLKANNTRNGVKSNIQNDQVVSSQSSVYHSLLKPNRPRTSYQQQQQQQQVYNQAQKPRRTHLRVNQQHQINQQLIPQQSYETPQQYYYQGAAQQNPWSSQQRALVHAPQPYYVPPESQQRVQNLQLGRTYRQPEYSQVLGGAGQRDARQADYQWRVTGVSKCNRTCGGGFQNTTVVCVEQENQAIVTADNCNAVNKPPTQVVPCNNNAPCPPSWVASEWTECSTTCSTGFQTRTVECKQRISDVITITVVLERCNTEPAPPAIQDCNQDNPCVKWKIGVWSRCSVDCGRGQRSREVACNGPDGQPRAENTCLGPKPVVAEICDMGSCVKTWFHSAWAEECSSECGEGLLVRRVHCAADDACAVRHRPRDTKTCNNEIPCGGTWFTSDWSKCTSTCGSGVKRRDATCLKKLGGGVLAIVSDDNCAADKKPSTEEACLLPECKPQWLHTEWSDCSTSCGSGTRTRELKCLDAKDEASLLCDPKRRPDTRKSCHNECRHRQEARSSSRPRKQSSSRDDIVPSSLDLDPSTCEDTYDNCQLVLQARLCPYYLSQCCRSCWRHRTA